MTEKEDFIAFFEKEVKRWQGKDIGSWDYWRDRLKELDPHNPLLCFDFRGEKIKRRNCEGREASND